MNESVLSVLVYLYRQERMAELDAGADTAPQALQDELLAVGFAARSVSRAFDWLSHLRLAGAPAGSVFGRPTRIFVRDELDVLDVACRGFLLDLERRGLIDAAARERVIDRTLALAQGAVSLDELRWVVLLVLSNDPAQSAAGAQLEAEWFGDTTRH